MKSIRLFALFLIGFFIAKNSSAQVNAGHILPGQVDAAAFTVKQPGKIKISGNGGIYYEDWHLIVFYGWIIDSQTRKVVWHQIDAMDKKKDLDYGEFNFTDEVSLNPGIYELYYVGTNMQTNDLLGGNGSWLNFFASNSKDRDFRSNLPSGFWSSRNRIKFKTSYLDQLSLSVSGQIEKKDIHEIVNSKVSGAIVSVLKPGKNANIKKGFSLSAPTALRIYAIGEGRKKEQFDYAWISNIATHNQVWEMNYSNTDYAGGADKNLRFDETINLPAGNYFLNYVSDDSHEYNNWNDMPPSDPQFSGVTIWPASEKDRKNVVPFVMPEEAKPVLEITKVHDNEFRSEGISIKAPVDLRVLCLGEEESDGLADGGWIVNANTHETVWDMSHSLTAPAGGAEKNKMFDGTIRLEKGDYIVYYSTDDSHSYGDWNSGAPHEQDRWGITLWATRKEDLGKIAKFDPSSFKSDKIVAEIVRVRDHERSSESFTLQSDTKLRIFAIGEGEDGEMVDYGWIKNNETGKTVWEMEYRNTENAGGAKKNRLANEVIILPKGSYTVHFETDGSHAFRNWNAAAPREPEKYGVTVLREGN